MTTFLRVTSSTHRAHSARPWCTHAQGVDLSSTDSTRLCLGHREGRSHICRGGEALTGLGRREREFGHVLGWPVSSLVIRAPCKIFADKGDKGTVFWCVFYHIQVGTDPYPLPQSLTLPQSQGSSWITGQGLAWPGRERTPGPQTSPPAYRQLWE